MSFTSKGFFYLVLPSNSSMKYFPDNTTTKFTTKLPRHLTLDGEWAVAVAEISYPLTFFHVPQYDNIVSLEHADYDKSKLNTITKKRTDFNAVPHGVYRSIDTLLTTINQLPCIAQHFELEQMHHGCIKVSRICEDLRFHRLHVSSAIAKLLGFDRDVETSGRIWHRTDEAYISKQPASLARAIPNSMFVYSDICESYITGDTQTPLLCVVPVETGGDYTYGANRMKFFPSPRYIPLIRNHIATIEIDIRDEYGKSIPFEEGTLTVTLQFKRLH